MVTIDRERIQNVLKLLYLHESKSPSPEVSSSGASLSERTRLDSSTQQSGEMCNAEKQQ